MVFSNRISYLVDMHTTPSDVIAKQVRKRRADLDINRDQLAERCAALGAPKLTAAAITNIETGRPDAAGKRRREVSAEELLVLGRALQVPPILLVFPLGKDDEIEVSPDVVAPTWPALKWFSGEAPFPHWEDHDEHGHVIAEVGEATDMDAWRRGALPIQLYRSHERHLEEWRACKDRATHYRKQAALPELSDEGRAVITRDAELQEGGALMLEEFIWEERQEMRASGLALPGLPESLSDLDDETSSRYREIQSERRQRAQRQAYRHLRDGRLEL